MKAIFLCAFGMAAFAGLLGASAALAADVVIAEGEKFLPRDNNGWRVTHQDDSWASHTYGGMWSTHGGLIGAPADSVGSVAVQQVTIPARGKEKVQGDRR